MATGCAKAGRSHALRVQPGPGRRVHPRPGERVRHQLCEVSVCWHHLFVCHVFVNRFGPREAGDGEMRQGATGRRQGGDRKTIGW